MQLCVTSWLLISSQEAENICLHQIVRDWREKPKSFVGPLSALDRGHLKCIVFATSFRTLTRSVICVLYEFKYTLYGNYF